MTDPRFDHVIVATADLEATAQRLRRDHGLASVAGGRHHGMGTANRIVPLGRGYLELLTVADEVEARTSAFGSWALASLDRHRETLMGWSVAVDDVEGPAHRLGTPVETIERAGLVAQLTGVAAAAEDPSLPFFIARGAGVADPGRAAADHRVAVSGVAWLELERDRAALKRWLGNDGAAEGLGVDVRRGGHGLSAVAIAAAGMDIVLRDDGTGLSLTSG